MTARQWLAENGYEDVAALIDQAIASIEAKGRKSRRNWWDTLAGASNGRRSVREGIQFPILRVAQIRQGVDVTPNAICRNTAEQPPDIVSTKRWSRRRLPSKARRPTRRAEKANEASKVS